MQFLALALAALPLLASADSLHQSDLRRAVKHGERAQHVPRAKTYKLVEKHQGQNFFDGWNFFTGEDPTHGTVDFQSQSEATKAGLAYVQQDNTTVVGVDNTTWLKEGQNRKSVRISTKKAYSTGLFIADFWSLPHGCGTWPAYWSLGTGKAWPEAGEIDIIEGVHESSTNQAMLHTGPGCNLKTDVAPLKTSAKVDASKAFTGNIVHKVCQSSGSDNTGCGFGDSDTRSYGHGFNMVAGGVYAHRVDASGIAIWHFARNEIPADITSGNPDPSTWPTPVGFWSSAGCNIAEHFVDHQLILDITLCGDWAGPAYESSQCPGTCASAVANPTNFKHAQFKINYISVYQEA